MWPWFCKAVSYIVYDTFQHSEMVSHQSSGDKSQIQILQLSSGLAESQEAECHKHIANTKDSGIPWHQPKAGLCPTIVCLRIVILLGRSRKYMHPTSPLCRASWQGLDSLRK